jgi:hypothetical protein
MSKRPCEMAQTARVGVKWGKESFPEVEVDLTQPPLFFKSQLFALSGEPASPAGLACWPDREGCDWAR